MSLVDWLDGNISRKQFVEQVMKYSRLYVFVTPHQTNALSNASNRIQERGKYIGNRSQFETLDVQDYIEDRNMMSTPRKDLVYPVWTEKGLDSM